MRGRSCRARCRAAEGVSVTGKTVDEGLQAILAHLPAPAAKRRLIAMAGPPAGGKSTMAEALTRRLNSDGHSAALVPMDGFHLDNAVLIARGLLPRKGAPETFDADGFVALVARLAERRDMAVPVFDRARDIAIAGAAIVPAPCDYVVIEGNYLLFDAAPWRDLALLWDLSVFLTVPMPLLRERLVARWRDYGLDDAAAVARAEGNDLPNARRILAERLPAMLDLGP